MKESIRDYRLSENKKAQLFYILAKYVEGDMIYPPSFLKPTSVSLLKFDFLNEISCVFSLKKYQAWSSSSWYFSSVAKWNCSISIFTRIRYKYFHTETIFVKEY